MISELERLAIYIFHDRMNSNVWKEKFEDTNRVIRGRTDNTMAKHYTEN